jgi:hypothetical protein
MVRYLIVAVLAIPGAAGVPAAGQAPGGPAAGQAAPCTTSAQYGTCSYPPYSVNQDMWNPGPGSTQTLTATSAGQWHVSTDQPSGAAVRSYPNVSQNLGQPISKYTRAVATFAERMPAGAAAEAAFDVWVNGVPGPPFSSPGMIEVMVWTQVDYGWEVRNTGGAARTFAVTSYRLRTAT